MKIEDLIKKLNLVVFNKGNNNNFYSGYTSDLLSDVMASAEENSIWITVQKHPNIIAVAKIKNISAIVLSKNIKPQDETLEKAKDESLWLLGTADDSFVISGKIYELLKSERENG